MYIIYCASCDRTLGVRRTKLKANKFAREHRKEFSCDWFLEIGTNVHVVDAGKNYNPYGVQPKGVPWGTFRISKKYMDRLRRYMGDVEKAGMEPVFHLSEAYLLYYFNHWTQRDDNGANPYWMEVTVRQYLSAATQRGILTRVRKGVYKFNDTKGVS
jgi:hypothetical protein